VESRFAVPNYFSSALPHADSLRRMNMTQAAHITISPYITIKLSTVAYPRFIVDPRTVYKAISQIIFNVRLS